ncbi:response regulator [Sporomusa sphaeroides]|uniref:response regulator n=1 Tax=Sporomusa sphaeroides TaxID=47679 RepID=UPI002BA3B7C2|nr:response regulator [Sporomusa sphaeroides]HML34975.1 response regulator [Sporomusa sphaeroides]
MMAIDVVILEDDPMVLELHRQYINQIKGFKLVGQACDGKTGFDLIARVKPQIVILDVYMPGLNGLDLLRRVRATGINTDVILVTAAHNSETIQQGIQYGAIDYIIKPFTFQRFKKALKNYQEYIRKINNIQNMSQRDVDILKGNTSKERSVNDLEDVKENIPKGLDKATLDLVLAIIEKKTGYFSVADISKLAGISRVTVRRYLNYLCESRCLKGILSYGPVGRPLHKYMKDDAFSAND